MAVVKIKPVKSALKRSLDYIQDPSKTDGKMLVSSFGCSYETAYEEFKLTLSKAMEKGNNSAHHLIQSFKPGETTKEQTHEIGKRLADDYTEEAIRKRIAGEYIPAVKKDAKPLEFVFEDPETSTSDIVASFDGTSDIIKLDKPEYVRHAPSVSLIVDIENCVKAQQSAGFARWQKIQNLKEAAKTLNFLTENNLLQYSDLERKAADVAIAFDETADSLKAAEKRLSEMARLMKHIADYQRTKPVYDGLTAAKDKVSYRREHESEVVLYEAAARALRKRVGDNGKLPNPVTLKMEYDSLMAKKSSLVAAYGVLKRQAREYGVVKNNVDSILDPGVERMWGKARGVEL